MEQLNQSFLLGWWFAFFERVEKEYYASTLIEEQGFSERLVTQSHLEDYQENPGKIFFVLWYKNQEYLNELKDLNSKKYGDFEEEKENLIQLLIHIYNDFSDSDFLQSFSFMIGYLSHLK